jgi:hypothetical protein
MKREKYKKKPAIAVAGRRIVKRWSTGEEVSITLGIPKEVAPDRWECLLEIKGLEKAHRHRVRGGDSLQALLLAIEEARCKLEEDGDRYVWVDLAPEYGAGLPRFIPTGMGPRFERRIDIALERESGRVWEARFKDRKADFDACEKELEQRAKILVGMQAALKRNRIALADWDKDLKALKAHRRSKSA